MGVSQMGAVESRFADIIWENEPLSAAELARMSEAALGWKKTTSYTVLKRLCEKGIFRNDGGTVTSLVSRADYFGAQSEQFVSDNFGGSLPAFFAAFASHKALTRDEIEELRRMVDSFEKEGKK